MPTGRLTAQMLDQAREAGKPLLRGGRDSQRSKVYAAEQTALRGNSVLLPESQILQLVRDIRSNPIVQERYGDPGEITVEISNRHKKRSVAFAHLNLIVLAAGWGQGMDVVIHEVAHLYAGRYDPGHSWLFCHIYLDLVRIFMGDAEADRLRDAFKARNVKFEPPRRRRQMTDAQRAAASERMAKARAARHGVSVGPHVFVYQRWDGSVFFVQSVDRCGWPKLTRYADDALVRKTTSGIGRQLKSGLGIVAVPQAEALSMGRIKVSEGLGQFEQGTLIREAS